LVWALIFTTVVIYLFIKVGQETELQTHQLKGYSTMARPTFWPRVLLVGLLGTGLTKMFLSARKPRDRQSAKNLLKHIALPKVVISVCIVALYCYLSQYLGFAFATMAFIAGYARFMGMRKLTILIPVPILSTLAILLVFWRILYVAVPKGQGIFLAFSNFIMAIVRYGT
jgi:hypothetical protein